VRVWDAATGKELATLTGHTGGVHCITISPDGKYLATGGDDKVVIVWNLTNNERVYSLGELDDVITSISFSPDAKRLVATYMSDTATIWDMRRASRSIDTRPPRQRSSR